jgi:hypothetical protein
VLSVEVLAGLHSMRQRLSFLNVRFLVSVVVMPNDLLIVKLEELHRIWNNSNVRYSGSSRNQSPSIPTVQRPRVWSDLRYMTETRTVLDCLGTVVFSLLECAPIILPAI